LHEHHAARREYVACGNAQRDGESERLERGVTEREG